MMSPLLHLTSSARFTLALLLAAAPGCAVSMNGEPLGPSRGAPAVSSAAPPAASAPAEAPASRAVRPSTPAANVDEPRARAEDEKEKKAKEREALVERSKETVALPVPQLGVSVLVPGDAEVIAKAMRGRSKSSYVQGPVSGFVVELADADDDRTSVDERIKRETAGMKNVQLVKKRSLPSGGYAFEFLWTQRFVDGNGFTTGTEQRTGVFVKQVVGTRAVHCYLFQGNEITARETVKRCEGLKPL